MNKLNSIKEKSEKKEKNSFLKRLFGKMADSAVCCTPNSNNNHSCDKSGNGTINIALAGNPNVGKSVIFNQLTGMSQTIGNWPGKTVERMEGSLKFLGYRFNIVDLPGIYSLSTFSLEEIVSREYIVSDEVDVIINVVDATNLERNLFFTMQLLELKVPMIIAINQMDLLRKRNIQLDFEKLEEIFQLPVMPVVAVHGKGVHELLEEAIEMVVYKHPHAHHKKSHGRKHEHHGHSYSRTQHIHPPKSVESISKDAFKFPDLSNITSFGKEVEKKVQKLIDIMKENKELFSGLYYPPRFTALKLLEDDVEIKKQVLQNENTEMIFNLATKFREELEELHGEDINTILSSEIYNDIRKILDKVVSYESKTKKRESLLMKFDHLTTHSFWGYIILILVIIGIYTFTFSVGDFLGGILDGYYEQWSEQIYSMYNQEDLLVRILWNGGIGGFIGAVGGVLVYVIPFFLIIEILQDSGYLPRAAFLLDRFMHAIGVHGKTIIPMILGFGCNVPACAGCRIMETKREKKLSIALTSLIPCAAVMTVVMGLVGRYLGIMWVMFLFFINFSVIILVGRLLNKTMPGQCSELIMEMHEYRMPNGSVITKQTWIRSKEFIFKALPLIIILGMTLEVLLEFRILDPINIVLSPITVIWLGLPLVTGVFLIYGILRKELTLVLLSVLANSWGLTLLELLTPLQMLVFSLVTMLYVPCFATIVIIAKQTNWKYALQISFLEIGLAILIGGLVHFGFQLLMVF